MFGLQPAQEGLTLTGSKVRGQPTAESLSLYGYAFHRQQASIDEHCISVMPLALFVECAGGNCISPTWQARSKCGSLLSIISLSWAIHGCLSGHVICPNISAETCLPYRFQSARDKGTERTLGHPGVLPRASCIQLIDIQLSQAQMISLLSPPFPPKGLGMSTGPKMHGFHRSILQYFPSCQSGSKLTGLRPSPSPAPVCRLSL